MLQPDLWWSRDDKNIKFDSSADAVFLYTVLNQIEGKMIVMTPVNAQPANAHLYSKWMHVQCHIRALWKLMSMNDDQE